MQWVNHYNIIPYSGCNMRCPHCFETTWKGETIKKEYVDIFFNKLDERYAMHSGEVVEIELFGGEPTVVPKMVRYIVDKINSRDYISYAFLFTNGTITIDEFLEMGFKPEKTKIQVSVQSITNLKVKHSWQFVLDLVKHGFKPVVNTVVNHLNIEDTMEVYNFMKKHKALHAWDVCIDRTLDHYNSDVRDTLVNFFTEIVEDSASSETKDYISGLGRLFRETFRSCQCFVTKGSSSTGYFTKFNTLGPNGMIGVCPHSPMLNRNTANEATKKLLDRQVFIKDKWSLMTSMERIEVDEQLNSIMSCPISFNDKGETSLGLQLELKEIITKIINKHIFNKEEKN